MILARLEFSWLYMGRQDKFWLRKLRSGRSGSPVGGKRAEFDRVAKMLSDIVGDRESFMNLKHGKWQVFSKMFLPAAQ